MRKISKALAVTAVVLGIGGIGLAAVGQPAGPGFGPGGFGPGMMGNGPGFMHGPGGPGAMGGWGGGGFAGPAVRLDALKARLAVRPEQQAAWDAYTKAVQDAAAQMQTARAGMFDAMRAADWQEHQAIMAKLFDQRATARKAVEAAATTLLAALDDTQKTHALLPALTDVGPGMMGWHGGAGPAGNGGMMGWGWGGGR